MAAPNLGAGATVTFATTSFAMTLTRIKLPTESRGAVDVTPISSDFQMEKIPAAKGDLGPLEIEGFWDPAFSTFPPISSARELITIDYDGAGAGTDTMTFTGFVTNSDPGEIVAAGNNPMMCTVTVQPDGGHNSGTALTH